MSRTSLTLIVAAAILGGASSRSFAQNDLDRILERDKIAAQKLQADVTSALERSRTLEKADPSRAADLLQETLIKVRNATELSVDERVRLVQRLQIRVREVTAAAQRQKRSDDEATRQKLNQEARDSRLQS